ncbi:MAG: hypothetical protein ACRC35_14535 [Angustibacter sp.]
MEVPEVPGAYTQARRLDQVEAQVADAVATMLDLDAVEVEVEVEPVLPQDLAAELDGARQAAREATAAQAKASREVRAVAAALTAAQFSRRDVGALLGVSHQRVSQLAGPAGAISAGVHTGPAA